MFTLEPVAARYGQSLLNGDPGTKVWQSRILGPYLVLTATKITGLPFAKCHWIFAVGMLFFSNLIPFLIFRRLIENIHAVYALVLLNAAGLVAVHPFNVLFDFDLIDFNTMFLFAYAVFFGMPLWGFILLFIVELLNREAAQLMALWLIIDGLVSFGLGGKRLNILKAGIGVALLASGIAWTQFIRSYLIRVENHERDSNVTHLSLGEAVMLKKNFEDLMLPSLMLYSLLIILVYLYVRFARYKFVSWEQALKVGLLLMAFLTALALFAIMSETRDWYEVIPFMVFMYMIPLGLAKGYK